jgi:large subunit ribosomal protein L4
MKIAVFTEKGEKKEDKTVSVKIFDTAVNPVLIHEVVIAAMANRRMDNAKTKTRGLVAGGGKKPWKQKGTGRARSGSVRNPVWRGGGITFGPTGEQNHYKEVPKKKKRSALLSALATKKEDFLIIEAMPEKGTKEFAKTAEKILDGRKGLFVYEKIDEKAVKASRNIQKVKIADYRNLNTYDVLNADKLIFVGNSLDNLVEFLG